MVELVRWETLLLLTIGELRRLGTGSRPVGRRLRSLIEDLLTVVPPFRRGDLERQRALLDRSVASAFATD